MRISIKDIARRAGVSHSTVSRALADSPLISDVTKAQIRQLAQEMGYSPSAVARAMSTRRTRTVGVVVTSIADSFVAEVVRGIEETALNYGYNVILCASADDPDREVRAVRTLREKWVDAVIVTASRVGSFYAELTEISVPVVLINNQQLGDYGFSVRTDDFRGGQLVGEYLLGLGHRHIAYISGREAATSSRLRLDGCQAVLGRAGIEIPTTRIIAGDGSSPGGAAAVRQLFAGGQPVSTGLPVSGSISNAHPTVVFCYNDRTAMGALGEIKALGLRVPQDVSLIGYDDIDAAAYLDPPLTTVAQDRYALGQNAMEMALALIANQPAQDILLQPQLMIRASCTAIT